MEEKLAKIGDELNQCLLAILFLAVTILFCGCYQPPQPPVGYSWLSQGDSIYLVKSTGGMMARVEDVDMGSQGDEWIANIWRGPESWHYTKIFKSKQKALQFVADQAKGWN